MNKIKKTLLTLVALLAVTTGAWAQPWTSGDCTVTISEGVMTVSGTGAMADYKDYNHTPWYGNYIKTIVIESGVTGIGKYALASCYDLESVSIPASMTSIGFGAFEDCGRDAATAMTVSFAEGSTPLTIGEGAFGYANLKSIDIPNRVTSIGRSAFASCSNLESVSIPASVTSISEEAFRNCSMLAKVYIYAPSLTTYGTDAFQSNATGRKIYVLSDAVDTYKAGWPAYAADFVGDLQPLASGTPVEVDWNKTSKTGTFDMPGGNVIVEPEYYPQAALTAAPTAINDVPATTDGAIVNAGTVANIGSSTTPQGTVMYYAVQSATAPTAPDYDATGWTDKVPTATDFAEGNVYVWYYIKGAEPASGTDRTDANTCSDSEITALGTTGYVTLAAPPTYAITLKEGTEDVGEWTISPAEATKGTTITATYSGTKRVKSVKAVKKAAVDPAKAYLKWDNDQKKLVATEIPTTAIKVANADAGVEWQAGTYVVDGEVNISGTITLSGDVNLIIKDGAKLTAQRISGASKNLSIYGQAQMTGELVVNSSTNDAITSITTLEVHSAKVTSSSSGNDRGGFFYIGTFNVYGGSVDAENTAADGGYGIAMKAGGFMNIHGGEVKAVGKGDNSRSNGINGGDPVEIGTVTVYGGKLWAENADDKALRYVNLQKGAGFTGKIETSNDNSAWAEYTGDDAPTTKYVRVGY